VIDSDELRAQIMSMSENVEQLESTNFQLTGQMQELREQLAEAEEVKNTSTDASADLLMELRTQIADKENTIQNLSGDVHTLETELGGLRERDSPPAEASADDGWGADVSMVSDVSAAEETSGGGSSEEADSLRQQQLLMQAEIESLKQQLQNAIPPGDGLGGVDSYFGSSKSTESTGDSEEIESLRHQLVQLQEKIAEAQPKASTVDEEAESEALRAQITTLSKHAERLENANFTLEGQVEELREQLEEGNRYAEREVQHAASLSEQVSSMTEEKRELETAQTALEGQLEDLRQQLVEAKDFNESSGSEVAKLKEDLAASAIEVEEAKASAGGDSALKAKLEKYVQGFTKAKELITTLKGKCQSLAAENTELETKLASTEESEASGLREQIGGLESANFKLESEVQELKDQVAETEDGPIDTSQDLRAELQEQVATAEAEIKRLSNELFLRPEQEDFAIRSIPLDESEIVADLKRQVEELQDQLRGSASASGSVATSSVFPDESPYKRAKLLSMQQLQGDVKSLEAELKTAHARNAEADAQFKMLSELRVSMEAQVKKLDGVLFREGMTAEELQDIIRNHKTLQAANAAQEAELSEMRGEAADAAENRSHLEEQVQPLGTEIEVLESARSVLGSEAGALREELENGRRDAAVELEAVNQEVAVKAEELEELRKELASLNSAAQAAANTESELQVKLDKYMQGFAKAKELIGTLKVKNQGLTDTNAGLSEKVASLALSPEALEGMQRDVATKDAELEEMKETHAMNLQKSTQAIEDLQAQLTGSAENGAALEGLKLDVAEKGSELEHLKTQHAETVELHAAKVQEYLQTIGNLEAVSSKNLGDLHAAVAAKETEIEQLKAEYAAQPASDEVGELQQKLNEYTQDFAEAKEMSATLTQQCQNLTAENEALQQKLVSLEASQGAKETGGAEGEDVLRQQIKAMNADLSTLEGTNFSLESEVEDLREQLQEAQENGSSSSSSSSSSSGFSAEMVDLKEQIAAKDAEILELRAGTVVAEGNEEIKAKLEKYMAGFAKAKELCGTLREKVKGLTATNMELQGKVADADDLQAKLDKFTLGFTKAKELSVTLKEKNRDLTVANTELQEKLASLEETPVESTTTEMLGSQQDESGEIDALRQQVSELTEQLMVERATLEAEAKASTALLDGVVQGLHENVREHAAIIDTLREELVTKEDSRASADGEAAVAGGGEELKAKLEKYMQGFQKAKAACGTLKERCQGLTAANAELQQKVASADELQAKLDKYTQGFAKAKEMCAGLKEQCTALTAEKEALQAHIASLPSSDLAAPAAIYTKLDEYIVVCGVLEEKCELLTSQNTELQDKLSSLEALGTISVGDVELKAKLEKYVQAFNKAKELCTTLKEKAKSLEGANTELQDKVTLLETGSQEMHATCQKLTADNGTLQETVANLEAGQGSKVAGGSEDAEALRQKIKSLKDEMSNLGGTNFSLESEVEDLREQLAEAQQDGGGGDSNVNSEEVATLKTQIAALVAEILELRAVAGGDEFSSEEVNSMIQEQIAAKEEQFSELRRAAGGSDELRAMIDRLREQLDEALQGGDGNEGDSEELAILKEAMAAKDSEIEQLREELDGSTVEADARLEELRSLTSASEASSAVETELKAKLAKYSEGFAKAKELVGTHKKKCQDLENDNAALEDANAALRQKLISLSASPKKVVELQGKLDKYQQGFAKAQELFPEEVEVLRQQIASMNEDMNKLEGTNFSLESELGDLREQLEEAQLEGIPKSATSDDSSEIDALKAAVAAKEAEIEQLRAGLIEADELDQLRGELSNASEAATAAESELEAKVEKYTQEYYKSKELCGTLNEKCIVLIAENAALQEKVASLEPPKAAGVTDGNKTEVDDLREKIALMTAGLAKSKEMMQSLSDQLQSKEEELERIRVGAGSTSGPLDLTKRVKELEAEVGGMQFSFEAEREDMEESHASKVAELQRQIAVMDAQAPTEGGGDKEELANAERKYAELLEERSIADAHAASYKEEVASLKSKLAVITEQQSGRSDEDSSKGSMEEMVSNLGMAKAECEELQANMHNKEVELIQLREFLTARDAEIVALGQRKSQVEMGQGDSQLADRIRVLEEALVASKEEVGGLQFSFDAELEDVQETNAAKIVALEQRISKLSSGARNTNGGDPEALAALELTLAAERHHLLEERSAADAQMAVHKEEVANLQSKIAALTDEIASLREVADEAEESGLQAQLQSKEGELVELRTAVWDKDTEIVGLSQYLSQAESSAVELGAELAELREAVAAKDAEAKEHSVWSQRSAELQLTVGELRSTVEKRDETIATLRAEVVPDASIAARVQELEAELEEKARALKEAATSVEAMGSELQQQNAEMLELQGRGATVSSEGGSAASEEMEALRAERDSLSEKLEKVVVAFKASKESQKDGGKSEIKKLKGKLAKLLEVWKATKAEVDELRGQTAQEAAESGPGDTPVKSTSPEREAKEVASPDSAASDGAAPVATVALLGLQADVARLQQALADSQSASEQEKRGLSEELKLVRAQATKFEEQARHAQAQAQELQAQQRSPVTTSVKADPEAAKKLAMREQEVSRLRGKLQVLQAGVDDRERFINLMSNKLESVTGDLEKEKIMCESKVAAAKEAAGKKKGGWFGGKKAEVVDENEGKEWDGRQWVVPSEAPALPPMPPRPKPIKLVDSPEMGSMAAPVGLSSSASMPLLPPPPSNKYGAVQGRKFVNAFAGDDFGGDAPPAAAPPAALMPSMPSMPMSLAPMMPAPLSPSTAPASPTGKPAESAIKEPANDAIAETESELPAIASPFALPPAKPSFTPPAPTPSAATTASAPSISSEEVEALRDEIKQLKEQLEVRGAEGGDEDDDESANEKDPAKACRLLRRQLARNTKLLKTSNTRTRQLEQQMAKVAPSVRGAFAGAEGSAALPAAGVPTPIPLPGVVSGDPANKEELTKARGQITLLESEVGRLRSEVQKLTDQLSRAPPPQQALRSMPAPTTASPAGQNGADDERSRAELDRAKGVLEKLASKLNAMGSEVRPELGAAPPSPLSDPAGFEQWSTRLLDALARIPKASASTVSPVPAPARTTSSPALPASAMTSTTAVTPSSLSPSLLAALSRATTGVVVSTSPFFMSTVVLMVVAVVFPELAPLLEGFV
jgi:chromosome segregation ATPase